MSNTTAVRQVSRAMELCFVGHIIEVVAASVLPHQHCEPPKVERDSDSASDDSDWLLPTGDSDSEKGQLVLRLRGG